MAGSTGEGSRGVTSSEGRRGDKHKHKHKNGDKIDGKSKGKDEGKGKSKIGDKGISFDSYDPGFADALAGYLLPSHLSEDTKAARREELFRTKGNPERHIFFNSLPKHKQEKFKMHYKEWKARKKLERRMARHKTTLRGTQPLDPTNSTGNPPHEAPVTSPSSASSVAGDDNTPPPVPSPVPPSVPPSAPPQGDPPAVPPADAIVQSNPENPFTVPPPPPAPADGFEPWPIPTPPRSRVSSMSADFPPSPSFHASTRSRGPLPPAVLSGALPPNPGFHAHMGSRGPLPPAILSGALSPSHLSASGSPRFMSPNDNSIGLIRPGSYANVQPVSNRRSVPVSPARFGSDAPRSPVISEPPSSFRDGHLPLRLRSRAATSTRSRGSHHDDPLQYVPVRSHHYNRVAGGLVPSQNRASHDDLHRYSSDIYQEDRGSWHMARHPPVNDLGYDNGSDLADEDVIEFVVRLSRSREASLADSCTYTRVHDDRYREPSLPADNCFDDVFSLAPSDSISSVGMRRRSRDDTSASTSNYHDAPLYIECCYDTPSSYQYTYEEYDQLYGGPRTDSRR
ncbi:hypothetical protein S40288_07255 [Stachybotrys chartarum IBT 40288]|nr:hypothetical protein S40288_07255 [Stachybotrys chartarum IBT 40288]